MLKVTRYINGVKIDEQDLDKYIVENDVISRTISTVNLRRTQ